MARLVGKNGVLSEMLKCCGVSMLDRLVQLFQQVWEEGSIPSEWKDTLIDCPHPQEG